MKLIKVELILEFPDDTQGVDKIDVEEAILNFGDKPNDTLLDFYEVLEWS